MPIAERIPPLAPMQNLPTGTDPWCLLSSRWGINLELAYKLGTLAWDLYRGNEVAIILSIISGFRTAAEQELERKKGRPTAPDHLSNHRSCPATAADVWPNIAVTDAVKLIIGEAGVRAGLRWGGGSKVTNGIPFDWNHFDLGPRKQ